MRNGVTLACAIALSLGASPICAVDMGSDQVQRTCSQKLRGAYGFLCQGFVSGAPATYVGTVTGSDVGYFEGSGTFTTPLGSQPNLHAAGTASFQDSTCFGHIEYQLSAGTTPMGTLEVDFAVGNGGSEILGAPNSWNGSPVQLTCHLVKVNRPD